jgi:hypothetical protein
VIDKASGLAKEYDSGENGKFKLDMVAYTCNPSTGEVETGGSQVLGQPGLHSEILLQKKQKRKKNGERKFRKKD